MKINLDTLRYNSCIDIDSGEIKGYSCVYSIERAFSCFYINCLVYSKNNAILIKAKRKLYDNSGNLDYAEFPDTTIDCRCKELASEIEKQIFTEEELITRCKTTEEYTRKLHFIKAIYINNVQLARVPMGEFVSVNEVVYDPISNNYVFRKDEQFVKHHIELYSKLIKNIKPSIFSLADNSYYFHQIFNTYYSCLPFADDDDPMLEQVKAYLAKNARRYVLENYTSVDSNIIPIRLVSEGYIKKPTAKKLLEKANAFGDSQFAAVLLDAMKDKTKNKTKFDL